MPPVTFAPGTLFSRFFHASPVAMCITELNHQCYLDVNEAYAQLVERPRMELIGRPNVELPPAHVLPQRPPNNQPVAPDGLTRLYTSTGKARDVLVSNQYHTSAHTPFVFTLVQDLTDQFQAQNALASSEARFKLFFESLPLAVLVFDFETLRILDANTAATQLYGYSIEELLSLSMLDIRPPSAREKFLNYIEGLPDETQYAGTWRHQKKDGTLFDVEVTSYAIMLDGRRTRIAVIQDVTERLLLQKALSQSEERLRIIADVTTDTIWDHDLIGEHVQYSHGLHSVFGHSLENTSAPEWWIQRIHPEDRPGVMEGFNEAIEGDDSIWSAQYRFRRADNTYAHILDRGYILRDDEGRAMRMIGAMVDITRQVEIKEAATRAAMEERRRLARDLHDAVTQSLYSLSLMAEAARRRAYAGDEKASADYIVRLGELAQQSLKEMRLLVYELQPSVLANEGLYGALQARLDAVERRAGVKVTLFYDVASKLPSEIKLQLYRVAEEALNNSLKHAGATSVHLHVKEMNRSVTLELRDNGCGFDPNQLPTSGGLGLTSMRERVERLGGQFHLETSPGEGTTILVTLTLTDDNHEQSD